MATSTKKPSVKSLKNLGMSSSQIASARGESSSGSSGSSSSSKTNAVPVPDWAKGSQYDTGLSVATQNALSKASTSTFAANITNTPSALNATDEEAPVVPGAPEPIAEEPAPEDGVATGQPNPGTVTAQPFTNPDGTVVAGSGETGTGQGSTPSSYEQGFNTANAALGGVAPQGGAAGSALVSQYSPSNPSNPGTQFVQTDPYIEGLVTAWQQYIDPKNQRASLTETYAKMLKTSGIEAIDMELLNMKNVIEGSEDDIRTEVTKAGGFATDSQVLALTNARNKQLIKNYNTLLETRNSKEKYLETAIQLEQKDRESADRRFESAFSMGLQIADYHQKMKTNAEDRMRWNIEQMGFDGVYDSTGGDPYSMGIVEQTLGMPKGGLAIAADQARQARELASREQELDLQLKGEQISTEQARRASIYNDMNPQGPVTVDPNTGQRIVTPIAQNSLPDLLLQYRNKVEDSTKFGRLFNPNTSGELDSLRGQITAVYKQEQKLGTLDAGVQKLIDSIIGSSPDGGIRNLGGITTFLNPLSGQNQGAILKKVDNFLTNQSGIDLSKKNDLKKQMKKGEIMVIDRNTRQIGAIPQGEFNSSLYIKI